MNTLLAHGGGIPETLSVLVPLGIAVLLLRAGRKPPEDEPVEGDDVSS